MKITVFTPTYNRAYIIENLYRSLQRQTCKDFEWLVVDDGSTDNTEELFSAWKKEKNDFLIRYYKKDNGGKGRAINYGVDRAEGELFFNVDSDDYLTDDAIEKICRWEATIAGDNRFCGVVGNLGTAADFSPNMPVEGEYRDASLLERYPEYSDRPITGEHAWAFYTVLQRKYKYPEFEGEKFITPAVPWNRMAHDGYLVRVFNDIIWIYEYQPDGLSMAGEKKNIDNPHGYGLTLKEKAEFCHYSILKKYRLYYSFCCDFDGLYSPKEIAGFIGAPIWFMKLSTIIHHIISRLKKP